MGHGVSKTVGTLSLPPTAVMLADTADVASYAARPYALRLLRQLAQASKLAARSLLETGKAQVVGWCVSLADEQARIPVVLRAYPSDAQFAP